MSLIQIGGFIVTAVFYGVYFVDRLIQGKKERINKDNSIRHIERMMCTKHIEDVRDVIFNPYLQANVAKSLYNNKLIKDEGYCF